MSAQSSSPSTVETRRGTLTPEEFDVFAQLANKALGIQLPRTKLEMMQSRLLRRLRELGLSSFEEYHDYLLNSPEGADEMQHFFDRITTNRTEFYREADHFAYLVQSLPRLARSGPCRVWSAGCSSGEEVYTLAMLLADYAIEHHDFDFELLASDISMRMLEQAREAIYPEPRILPVPMLQRRRFLLRGHGALAGKVRICPALRAKVSFFQLNFMSEKYSVKPLCRVIFFRNVLIYFNKPTQQAVLRKLCDCLLPQGLLFTGHTEAMLGFSLPLEQVAPGVFCKTA